MNTTIKEKNKAFANLVVGAFKGRKGLGGGLFAGVLKFLTVNLTLTRSLALETRCKGGAFASNIESERADLRIEGTEIGVAVDSS
jgi:hypothetical protein